MATYGGTVKFFSPATRNVTTVYSGDEDFRGMTYDPVNAKLYWSSNTKIYSGNMDGTEASMVFNTTRCKQIFSVTPFILMLFQFTECSDDSGNSPLFLCYRWRDKSTSF